MVVAHQASLFGDPPKAVAARREPYRGEAPYAAGSDTSKAAAVAIEPKRLTNRERVLEYVRSRGAAGATDDEISRGTGLLRQSICPARKVLMELGQLVDSGQRRVMSTGRQGAVWVAREFAARAAGMV